MTQRKHDPRAALVAQRPPADAVSYMPPPGRLSLIIKLVGTDNDRLTRPGERGLWCYTDRLSYLPGDEVRFHTSTSASRYSIEIARVGARRELVWTRSGIRGALHPTPPEAFPRLRVADGFAFRIPGAARATMPTLRASDEGEPLEWTTSSSRARCGAAKILMILSTNTMPPITPGRGRPTRVHINRWIGRAQHRNTNTASRAGERRCRRVPTSRPAGYHHRRGSRVSTGSDLQPWRRAATRWTTA
jgi:hypothetical protein